MAMIDKKAQDEYKRKHDLHVLLIQEQEKATKAKATIQAYAEGIEGVAKRLGQGDLLSPLPHEPVKTK